MKPQEIKTKLILSASQSDEPAQAIVIGVGEKVEAPVKEGDLVLLAPYAGHKMKGGTDNEPYLLLSEKEVLGILRD